MHKKIEKKIYAMYLSNFCGFLSNDQTIAISFGKTAQTLSSLHGTAFYLINDNKLIELLIRITYTFLISKDNWKL